MLNNARVISLPFIDRLGRWLDSYLEKTRMFFFKNASFTDGIFLCIYSSEQLLLVIFSNISIFQVHLGLLISIFAIIVLGTSALEKIFMKSRIQILEEKLHSLRSDNSKIVLLKDQILANYKILESESYSLYKRYLKIIKEHDVLISQSQNLNTKSCKIGNINKNSRGDSHDR